MIEAILSNISGIVTFILPGFLVVQIHKSIFNGLKMPQFELIIWSLCHSLVILVICENLSPIITGASFELVATSLNPIILVVVTFLYAVAYIQLTKFRFKHKKIDVSVWKLVIETDVQWCIVFLKDGRAYFGGIEYSGSDPDDGNKNEILLRDAVCVERDGQDIVEKYKVTGKGVYLKNSDIRVIEFVASSVE